MGLLRIGDLLLLGFLFRGDHGFIVVEVSAVDAQPVGHLDDRVHMRQQGSVVGDDECRSAPLCEQGRQQCASVLVEIVARFVEDQPGIADQCCSGQSDASGLPAGEAAQAPVEVA